MMPVVLDSDSSCPAKHVPAEAGSGACRVGYSKRTGARRAKARVPTICLTRVGWQSREVSRACSLLFVHQIGRRSKALPSAPGTVN
jgi:hypothetical protein